MKTFRPFVLVLLSVLGISTHLFAHTAGENYVLFNVWEDRIDGAFEITTEDLEKRFGIEFDGEDDLVATIEANAEVVQAYLKENFSISADGEPFPIKFTDFGVRELPNINLNFAQYRFEMNPGRPIPRIITIENTILFELSRLHRSLVGVMENVHTGIKHGDEAAQMSFGPNNSVQELNLTDIPELLGAKAMIPQGVLHIWIGIDHILFLLCLLLPTVLIRKGDDLVPVETFRSVFWRVVKIVTLFTIAHSMTLALAAFDFISISSRLVESIIALSIVLVALNNFIFRISGATYVMILILGLFHGLGFASVMGNLPFQMKNALKVVVGFNIGVEIGQMIIVAAVFPILYYLRKHPLYIPAVLKGGSTALGLVASYWFVQRAFGLG